MSLTNFFSVESTVVVTPRRHCVKSYLKIALLGVTCEQLSFIFLCLLISFSIWNRMVALCTRKRNQNPEDIESGVQANLHENKEVPIYEKKGRSPSGHGIVKINADSIELIDESYLNEGAVNPPVAPPLPTVENTEEITGVNQTYFEVGGYSRRASEKVKVIRRLSDANGCTSLQDQILLAKDVITDHVADDGKVFFTHNAGNIF